MAFRFFPKEDYVLESLYTPPEIIDILSANISALKEGMNSAERKNMGSRYFEGEINRYNNMKFTVRHNDRMFSSALNKDAKLSPVNGGTIKETINGSSIHIVATPPLVAYLYMIGFFLFPAFLFICSFPIIVDIVFLLGFIIVIFSIRFNYISILRKDKEKFQLLFKS